MYEIINYSLRIPFFIVAATTFRELARTFVPSYSAAPAVFFLATGDGAVSGCPRLRDVCT